VRYRELRNAQIWRRICRGECFGLLEDAENESWELTEGANNREEWTPVAEETKVVRGSQATAARGATRGWSQLLKRIVSRDEEMWSGTVTLVLVPPGQQDHYCRYVW
jgi:hypothetical protein